MSDRLEIYRSTHTHIKDDLLYVHHIYNNTNDAKIYAPQWINHILNDM